MCRSSSRRWTHWLCLSTQGSSKSTHDSSRWIGDSTRSALPSPNSARTPSYVYEKLDQKMDAGFAMVDAGFAKVEEGFSRVDGRFARLERKIDQIIDLHAPRTPPNESEAG